MAECPTFLKPRLRLFLSADIVGSTALKQSRAAAMGVGAKDNSSWFSVIQGFYIECRRTFLDEWMRARDQSGAPELFGDPPVLWKTIGDEVLFVKVLSDHRQLAVTLKCWVAAIQRMRVFVRDRDPRLDVKCTAWTAGFPVKNKEVVVSNASELDGEVDDYFLESGRLLNKFYNDPINSSVGVDYIGPSIDIGFRLAGFSTSRKFVIGVDAAYILALTSPRQDDLIDEFGVCYAGSFPLKGVFGGVNYPIFWLDMALPDALASFEDKMAGVIVPARDDIRKYCDIFYKEFKTYTFRPFIESETEQLISEKPDGYKGVHENLAKNFIPPLSEVDEVDEVSQEAIVEADIDKVSREIVVEIAPKASDAEIE